MPRWKKNAAHPAVAAVLMPPLFRTATIEADLLDLTDSQTPTSADLCPATKDYVERLELLAAQNPSLLVAHAYVRFLGDLNGGQALQRVVSKSLKLQSGTGTAFYDFGGRENCQRLIQQFKQGLTSIVAPIAVLNELVAEAVSAFERHGQLFSELSTES
jgi:heme oxygenase (biliverdin-producing, ferredoxin)